MAADRGERPRDSRGRFLSKEEAAKRERARAPADAEGREQTELDAMGRDKRRGVVGGRYSPSLSKQATLYGAFIAIVAVLGVGFVLLANELDQPPSTYPDEAAWSSPDAEQIPPAPLDLPRNGSPDVTSR